MKFFTGKLFGLDVKCYNVTNRAYDCDFCVVEHWLKLIVELSAYLFGSVS